MIALKDFTKNFFEIHYSWLSENYPGISCDRLLQELEALGEDVDGSYFPNMGLSWSNFFFESIAKGIPLEYVGKKCYFFRSYFEMRENVFIPRSETEMLVEEAVKELHLRYGKIPEKSIKILDVGTGSGNIILSIMQEYPGSVDAIGVDISKEALELAQRNAFCLQYTFSKNKKVQFLESDRLSDISQRFHLIVSNPPYIKKRHDREDVHPQVVRWEPCRALYLEDEQYEDWFKEFFIQVRYSLVPGGAFFMEGHESHLKELERIVANLGGFASIEIKNDYTLRNRFLLLRV